jgi:hypothetical protein
MGGVVKSGNLVHDAACSLAEGVRQAAVAAVTQNAAGQVTSNNAEIAYHRAVIASCKLNNSAIGLEASMSALRALGTGGT